MEDPKKLEPYGTSKSFSINPVTPTKTTRSTVDSRLKVSPPTKGSLSSQHSLRGHQRR